MLGFEYWGKGIATKVVRMVVEMAVDEFLDLERLEALVDVDNLGSQRVLEKAGFHREGVLRKFSFVKGKSRDMVMFSVISDQVRARLTLFVCVGSGVVKAGADKPEKALCNG